MKPPVVLLLAATLSGVWLSPHLGSSREAMLAAPLRQAAPGLQQNVSAPPAATAAYETRCGACHGAKLTGGSGPSILPYVRYHTDAEVRGVLRTSRQHASLQMGDDEVRQVIADIRVLAGTNPAMATGGYTGRRGGGGGGGRAGGAGGGAGGRGGVAAEAAPAVAAGAGIGGNPTTTITLADGRTLTGVMATQSDIDATLLSGGRFYLLARDGEVYREKAIAPQQNWLSYDGGLIGNRYSTLDRVNASNVQRLAPAWIFPMASSPRLEVTPVVADGIMYVTGWNEIAALDATTGRQLWAYSELRHEGILSEGGNGANRGATIAGDRVFFVTDHAHLVAFDRFTGRKLWDVEIASYLESYSATAPPLAVGDLLVVGVAGGEEGARGLLDAYRVSTGERVWRFYTIPTRQDKEAETWVGQALEHGCGATWLTGSYDPTLDLVYWGVGNPCPDFNGEERRGDNLYTSSVIALAAQTGQLKWYYQFTPHDTHDWDAVQPMVLADEPWQGKPRKLLLHADRNGMFYVLDRTNGQVLLVDNLSTKVTWHKGFTKGRPIVDPGSIATREGVAVCPAGGGGANWRAVSYNLITKLFYVRVSDGCAVFTSHEDPLGMAGNRWFGRGAPGAKAQEALAELMKGYRTGLFLRAMNPFTGKKAWDVPMPPGGSGVLSTAGGLLFVGGGGGLLALDANTGKTLRNINVGQNTAATPMTYMVGGNQYIALPGTGVIVTYSLN